LKSQTPEARSHIPNWKLLIAHFQFVVFAGFSFGAPVHAQRPPTPVIVDAVVRRNVSDEISIVGKTQPRRGGLIASQADGKVVEQVIEEGFDARRGDVILRMDNQQLRSVFIEATADLELQTFNYNRTEELFKQDVVPEQSFKEATYQLDRARAKHRELRNRIRNLDIRAPYDGQVVNTTAEIGEWVKRGDGVIRFIAMDTVFVYVNVPERHVDNILVGQPTALYIDALGTKPIESQVVAVIPEGFPESHTFPIIVAAVNPGRRIRSNMSARVVFNISRGDSVTLVHKDAIITGPTGRTVFLALDDKAVARTVKPGLAYSGYVEIKGDLKPGDLVIVRGNERLRDGQPVKVIRQIQ
jgi:membrane fusion protein (multidrug efflux system)